MRTIGYPGGFRFEHCKLARNYCQLGATNAEPTRFFDVATLAAIEEACFTRSDNPASSAGSMPREPAEIA